MSDGKSLAERFERWSTMLLVIVVGLAYLPSLSAGFLNWDDPWLVAENQVLARSSPSDVVAIWTDLTVQRRMQLGAEYLPVRDMSHVIESHLFGLRPQALRMVNLGLYLGAIVLLSRALRAVARDPWVAVIATWGFALHPVHVESVAWIAGRKDVLALLFVAAGMCSYARRGRRDGWWTAASFALAALSKSMSVAAVALLPVLDVVADRRPRWSTIGAASLVVSAMLVLHWMVGRTVGMTTPLAGGSHMAAAATMGPVWLGYLACMVWPGSLSIVHDAPSRTSFDLASAAGYLVLVVWGVLSVLAWRRSQRIVAVAFVVFIVPLVPVSQVLFGLQNRMADRYLWLSVLAAGLLLAGLWQTRRMVGAFVSVGFLVMWMGATATRANLFASSQRVFQDAVGKTKLSTVATYQLAQACEEQGRFDEAMAAYEETWRRFDVNVREHPADVALQSEAARRATNNLARLWAKAGDWEAAGRVLRRGLAYFPDDPKMRGNVAKVDAHPGEGAGEPKR